MRPNLHRTVPILALILPMLASLPAWPAQIDFDGNDNLSRKKIEAVLAAPEKPRELSAEDWEDWVDETAAAITDLYGETGYLDAAVKVDAPGRDSAGSKDDHIVIQIREGEQYRFGAVSVITSDRSASVIDEGKLKSRTGKPYSKELVFRDRREVLNLYGDKGYIHAKSSETLTPDTTAKMINVQFTVDPGTAVVFDTLMIRDVREEDSTGKRGVTSRRLLHELLDMEPGDTVSLSANSSFERKLKSSRAFNYVRLRDSLLESRDNRSALILSTEERVPGEADLSAFFETQYGAGLAADWIHGNLLGQLHESRLGGSWAQRKQTAYFGYSSPIFFGTNVRFDNDMIVNWYQDSKQQQGAHAFEGDFDLTLSSKFSRFFTYWLRGVSTAELTGQSQKLDSTDTEREFNLNFINSAYLSFMDNPISPVSGTRWSFSWGNGGSFLNRGEIDVPVTGRHNWLEGESSYYYPLLERVNLAFRLDGGMFFGDGGLNAERFFLGGPRSVRSFGWREICPDKNDTLDVCTTAGLEPAYFLTSFEVRSSPFSSAFINPDGRWRFLLGVQVVPFVDYGHVWNVGEPLTKDGEGQAFGLGLRYSLLSIFNLRVDYAVDGWSREHSQWVFDLAQAF